MVNPNYTAPPQRPTPGIVNPLGSRATGTPATGSGFGGGWSSTPNFGSVKTSDTAVNTVKNQLPEVAGLANQGLNALQSAYPTYLNSNVGEIQKYGTPEGQQALEANFNNQADAQGVVNGQRGANMTSWEGGSQQAQDAAREAAQQAGFESKGAFASHLASPEGAMQINDYLSHLTNNLGVGSPANQLQQQIFGNIQQANQVTNSAPKSGGFLQGLLGAAAPFLPLIPGIGPAAAAAGAVGSGLAGGGYAGTGQGWAGSSGGGVA